MSKLRVPDEKANPESTTTEGNLCGALVFLAKWRKCCVCGAETLFVEERGRSDADFECGLCVEIREGLAKRLARPSLPMRAALHLRGLFTTSNDNGTAGRA